MSDLAEKECGGCGGVEHRLSGERVASLRNELKPGWQVVDGHHLEREWKFPDFKQALAFTNRIGEVAETMGHHPDLTLGWGRVGATIFSHSAGGLTESDFVLAARIDRLTL